MVNKTSKYPRCPYCDATVAESDLKDEGYKWQCMDCDEDFYDFEVIHETNNNEEE